VSLLPLHESMPAIGVLLLEVYECPCSGAQSRPWLLLLMAAVAGIVAAWATQRRAKKGGEPMNATWKAVVVVALAVAVIAVVATKHRARRDAAPAANEQNETISWNSLADGNDVSAHDEPLPRLVDVGAGTCIPCKKMMPVLAELKTEYAGSLQVEYYNVNDDPNAIAEYDVTMIPTQIFYDTSGQERFRHTGFLGKKDILAKWNELGVELTRAK